ncbi:MAG: hypothetical protein NW216_07590 [Hyphomicrobium sp.]|nr:hypothetical protein [Hyphomicrobium sp.]
MATTDQTRQLSTPKIFVNGVVWPIKPNSFKRAVPGETKVRAMSAGGGAVNIVAGLNAEELKAKVSFTVANTKQMLLRVEALMARTNRGEASTVRIVDGAYQKAFVTMYVTNKPEASFEAEGDIEIEMEGEEVL